MKTMSYETTEYITVQKCRYKRAGKPYKPRLLAIIGFNCDNGSEFFNHHLTRYFLQLKQPVRFTRSRPCHKNDNAHGEQKNWTHVCELLGYDRLDNPAMLKELNALYRDGEQLNNFFKPSLKLKSKVHIKSRYREKCDDIYVLLA